MYTFEDLGGRSLTLRPELTASVVRSCLEHSLDQRGPSPETVVHRPVVPPGTSPERPSAPIPPVRCRGYRIAVAAGRCRGHDSVRRYRRPSGPHGQTVFIELHRRDGEQGSLSGCSRGNFSRLLRIVSVKTAAGANGPIRSAFSTASIRNAARRCTIPPICRKRSIS